MTPEPSEGSGASTGVPVERRGPRFLFGKPLSPSCLTVRETVATLRRMSSRRASWIVAALVVAVLAAALFVNSLSNGFSGNDVAAVTDDAAQNPLEWRTILLAPSWSAGGDAKTYRPFTTWTFAVGHALHGDDPFPHHLVNVVLHAGTSALVVLLASSLGLSVPVGALAGALFAVHPIHGEVVAAVVGRSALLAGALALLALFWQRRAVEGERATLLTAAVAGAYALALLAHEQAIALLVLLPLAGFVPVERASRTSTRAPRALLLVAIAGITLGYVALRHAALGYVIAPADAIAFGANPAASAEPPLRMLTALKVLAHAVWLLLVPARLSADYSYAHVPVVGSASELGAVLGMLTAIALLGVAVVVRRSPAALFWYVFALSTYLPVSNLFFPVDTIFREGLLYLPSIGFCALLAMALLRPTGVAWRAGTAVVAAVLVLGWSVGTVRRNLVWHDDASLADSMVASAPESARAHAALGAVYASDGRDDDALRELAQALKINPKETPALYNLGVIEQRHGKLLEALTIFRRVTDLDPGHFPAWINFASAGNSQGMFTPALYAAERAIMVRPEIPNGHVVRGFALRGLGRLDEARGAFDHALTLSPDLPDALLGLGTVAIDQGNFDEAARAFERLLAKTPSPDVYRGLVYSYRMAGRMEEAGRVAAAARERFPDDSFFASDQGNQNHD